MWRRVWSLQRLFVGEYTLQLLNIQAILTRLGGTSWSEWSRRIRDVFEPGSLKVDGHLRWATSLLCWFYNIWTRTIIYFILGVKMPFSNARLKKILSVWDLASNGDRKRRTTVFVDCRFFGALPGIGVSLAHSSPHNVPVSALVKLCSTEIIKAHPCFQALLYYSVEVKITGRDPSM